MNTCIRRGEYPEIYKYEVCTPVPKKFPPKEVKQMRNISGLLNFDKLLEKMLCKLLVADMKEKADPSQFGNEQGTSVQHYLISMLHRILSVLDCNSEKHKFAVIANLIDWNSAFPRQCPKLGVKSFMKNGVRASLIPLLTNYFQDRYMSVKWHGHQTQPRKINGGGPQGATLGILEYLSQSNDSADFVSVEDRFKFIDDLTILEIVNLISIGISSYNVKSQVPSDIATDDKFIPAENLESQKYLDQISMWTKNNKMKINENKSEIMVFNFCNDYQFSTRLELESQILETVKEKKLLGTIITQDLKWEKNTNFIIKRANMRLEILRRISNFGASLSDLKTIYISYIRSILEQNCTVWHSGLSAEDSENIERVQKTSLKIILKDAYKSYENALQVLELESLFSRREILCYNFAKKCLKNPKMKHFFVLNDKKHQMETRKKEKYKVNHAKTDRFKKSSIIYMQRLLNQLE